MTSIAAMQALEAMDAVTGEPIQHENPMPSGEFQREQLARLTPEKQSTLELDTLNAVRDILSTLWNGRQVGICEQFYSSDFSCHWASNRQIDNRADYQALVLSQLAAFPDLTFHMDDIIEQTQDDGLHVAVRWTMLGTHSGPSEYGKLSGKRVHIMGISQYVIKNEQFISERTEWNEFRLMQQIMERTPPPTDFLEIPPLSTTDHDESV